MLQANKRFCSLNLEIRKYDFFRKRCEVGGSAANGPHNLSGVANRLEHCLPPSPWFPKARELYTGGPEFPEATESVHAVGTQEA